MAGMQILFGKYEMGRLLGKGTFAKVYYGKHLVTGESVAIKVINKDQVRREGMMDQIQTEISVMHLVRHPNIVELKEVMATKTKIFFIMEGVYHRDLKPENLLLDEDENLKISDFGLSALREQFLQDKLLHTLCGTPAYVAPEVLRKKGYDGSKADIWSCGVILYVLLAGFLPFQDENVMKMYRKIFKAEYEFHPWFSADPRRLISRILVADPERRITIPAMMRNHWFLKGFSRPTAFPIQESIMDMNVQDQELDSCSAVAKPKASSPKFFNAFELISSMSSGFDLSGLFETEKKPGSIFTSKVSAGAIMEKIGGVAEGLDFKVAKVEDFKVRLQGSV
ncbi:hypothetical protein OIU77_005361 [Salix suchowensis]|uniref:non-specific serine/threonine protein kinase n=1 Tax=Salix suchowensis TaxID=1278906 RepID=A0ABQ9AP43_9ROSI|nr:hypothetical protein OIU77_005361 [Salix suchowensis]